MVAERFVRLGLRKMVDNAGSFEAYHSQYTDVKLQVGNMAVLPLRTQFKGPAPKEGQWF